MKRMDSTLTTWDTEEAARLAKEAYKYVARTFLPNAPLESLGRADAAVVEAEERGDWLAYVEALRRLCRTARREAQRARAACPALSTSRLRPS
jgi:hypothetical protein